MQKLRFRETDRDIFEAIRSGKKKVETRAAGEKYRKIKKGDTLMMVCGRDKFEKQVKNVKIFKTIAALLKKYKPDQINPAVKTEKELREMYYGFPNYREKIKKCGLTAMELN